MKRQDEWMQFPEAEDRTGLGSETLRKLVRSGTITKKPWYLPPFSVDLLRRGDVNRIKKPRHKV